jgi:hypothetical protein
MNGQSRESYLRAGHSAFGHLRTHRFTSQSSQANYRSNAELKKNLSSGKNAEEMPSHMVIRMSEQFKTCPHCAELVVAEAILCRFCDRGISTDHFKNCLYCDEMIWSAAVFCRYCKSTLREKTDCFRPNRKQLSALVKAGTGIQLDDDMIEKIFENMMKREK